MFPGNNLRRLWFDSAQKTYAYAIVDLFDFFLSFDKIF